MDVQLSKKDSDFGCVHVRVCVLTRALGVCERERRKQNLWGGCKLCGCIFFFYIFCVFREKNIWRMKMCVFGVKKRVYL